jgi:hypothetical protein
VSEPIGRPEGVTEYEWEMLGVSLYGAAEEAYRQYMISERGYRSRFAERTFEHFMEQLALYLLACDQERGNDSTFDEVFTEAWGHIRERYNREMIKAFDDVSS